MEFPLLNLLKLSYAVVGVLGLIAFLPTIKDLHVHKKPSANITSYFLWTLTSSISFLYSIFILNDVLVRVISAVNLLACILVLILSINLYATKPKKSFRRRLHLKTR